MRKVVLVGVLCFIWIATMASAVRAASETPLLVQSPTVNATDVVFVYGGYLWSVPRDGGAARQLTTGGHESSPVFSPDGKWLAFTGHYDGNADVFVMPAEGGEPKRLTWHPGPDVAIGWTPDGKRVLFTSSRDVARLGRFVLSRWHAHGLCSQYQMAGGVETLSRRPDDADLHRESQRPLDRKSSPQ